MKIFIGKSFILFASGFVLALILSIVFFQTRPQENTKPLISATSPAYSHLRPSSQTWDIGLQTTQELIPFRKSVEGKINEYKTKKHADEIAYYFRDLNNGPWFGINEDKEFNLASLFKVPTLMSYYHWAETNPDILQQKISFDGSTTNTSDNYFLTKPKEHLQKGKEYSIDDLINRMIIYSDNEAFRMLIEHADPGIIADPYNIVEMQIGTNGEEFTSTLREYAPFFRVLYNASYLNKDYSEKALTLLTKTDFKDGIAAGIPKNTEVAHKFGIRETPDGSKQLHECGIIYHKTYPYTLCIMTKGNDLKKLVAIINELSKTTYNEVENQTK